MKPNPIELLVQVENYVYDCKDYNKIVAIKGSLEQLKETLKDAKYTTEDKEFVKNINNLLKPKIPAKNTKTEYRIIFRKTAKYVQVAAYYGNQVSLVNRGSASKWNSTEGVARAIERLTKEEYKPTDFIIEAVEYQVKANKRFLALKSADKKVKIEECKGTAEALFGVKGKAK